MPREFYSVRWSRLPPADETPLSTCMTRGGSGVRPAAWSRDATRVAAGAAVANERRAMADLPNLCKRPIHTKFRL